jgi:hypothetical protein
VAADGLAPLEPRFAGAARLSPGDPLKPGALAALVVTNLMVRRGRGRGLRMWGSTRFIQRVPYGTRPKKRALEVKKNKLLRKRQGAIA